MCLSMQVQLANDRMKDKAIWGDRPWPAMTHILCDVIMHVFIIMHVSRRGILWWHILFYLVIVKKKGKGGPIAYWPLGRRTVRGSPCLGHSIWKAEPIPLLPLPFLPRIKSGTHLTAGWTEGVFQPLARVGFEPATFCFAVECANHSATRLH